MQASIQQKINKITRKNRTVIFTIHQPSADIYKLFDKLIFLVEGQVAFQVTFLISSISLVKGPAGTAIPYFAALDYQCPEHSTPSDFFMEIMHPEYRPQEFMQRIQLFVSKYQELTAKRVWEDIGFFSIIKMNESRKTKPRRFRP